MMFLKTSIAGAILSAACVDAFWRMECPHRVGLARVDPLMNPGTIAEHAHAIYGSNGFSVSSFYDELAGGDCTSCRVTQDKSAYWHPQLYFLDDSTGQYEEVNNRGGMLAYYFLNGKDIQPFKPGFRMIAGDNSRRDFTAPWNSHDPDPEKSIWRAKGYVEQDILKQLAIGVNCLNPDKPGEPTLMRHYLPDKAFIDENCPDGIRFELMFPSCWVGGDVIDSPNHMDHVAYPDTVMDGSCPDDFPVRLPGLMFESFYDTNKFKDRSGTFVLSNGDADGYGYHGDFISGWDEQTLGEAIKVCTNPSGLIEDCPVFNIQSTSEASKCNMDIPAMLESEDVVGPMDTLPGGLVLGDFVGDIIKDANGDVTEVIGGVALNNDASVQALGDVPAPEPAPEAPAEPEPIPDEEPAPVEIAAEEPVVPEEPVAPEEPAITEAPEPVVPEEELNIVSTDYIKDGNVLSKIVWVEEVVYVTETADEIQTVTVEAPNAKRAAHVHRHRRGHVAHNHR